MKSVLISIQPKWCELIVSGKKTVEVRKTRPKLETPFKVYIYQTKNKWIYKICERLGLYPGKVIGEFVCDSIDTIAVYNEQIYAVEHFQQGILQQSCLMLEAVKDYLGVKNRGYAWHISNLEIYYKPRELSKFYKANTDVKCKHKKKGLNFDFCAAFEKGQYFCKDLKCNNKKITRPPQSWCLVEEV